MEYAAWQSCWSSSATAYFKLIPRLQPSSKYSEGNLTWSGVDLFFVLSGFLIGGILLDSRESPNYFKTFYVRRAYRILPLYALTLALFSIRFLPFHWMPRWLGIFSEARIPWVSYATLTQNFWMAICGTFGAGTMAATWSLAVEEQFYLTIPFVIRRINRSRLAYVLLAIVAGAPLLRTFILRFLRYGDFANYVLMPSRADALCLGILAAIMVRSPSGWKWLAANRSTLYAISGALLAGLGWFTYRGYGTGDRPIIIVGYSCLALFYTCLLLIGVTSSSGRFHRLLCSEWLMQLGTLAYFTYLFHLPLMEACRRALGARFPYSSTAVQFAGGIIGITATIVLATFSWKYFEKPLLRKGHAYRF